MHYKYFEFLEANPFFNQTRNCLKLTNYFVTELGINFDHIVQKVSTVPMIHYNSNQHL